MNRLSKMKVLRSLVLAGLILTLLSCKKVENTSVEEKLGNQLIVLLQHAEMKFDSTKNQGEKKFFPRSLTESGQVSYVASHDWCSGFFAGNLWLMAELTGDTSWRKPATKYTELLENEQWNNGTHDMGFKMMSSYGNGLKQTSNPIYAEILVQSAKTLITRFNNTVGCLRSWDHNADRWDFPVIIDNMMNLELLFKATEMTGDSVFYKVAVKHADTTLKNHFRADNSSYHVVDYNPETGAINEKVTLQGDNNESAWARGQAWGLYGYTMCYRFTKNPIYLAQAQKIAEFIFSHPNLPSDKIPMWDFNYNEASGESRDVSAATVTASALFELAGYVPTEHDHYLQLANGMIDTLLVNYSLHNGDRGGFLLDHSVGYRHKNHEVNVPISYADYYFLEALIRQKNLNN